MNMILGNFDELVRFIHPVDVRGARTPGNEAVLQRLGMGIALGLQRACRRFFARVPDDTFLTTTDGVVVLPRYPVENITRVETRDAIGAWSEVTDAVTDLDEASGTVHLDVRGRVRITYTGGYWTQSLEPDELGYPEEKPATAFEVPGDLKMAWLLATQNAWEHKDHWVPKNLGDNNSVSPLALADLADQIPVVAQAIADYRRIAL